MKLCLDQYLTLIILFNLININIWQQQALTYLVFFEDQDIFWYLFFFIFKWILTLFHVNGLFWFYNLSRLILVSILFKLWFFIFKIENHTNHRIFGIIFTFSLNLYFFIFFFTNIIFITYLFFFFFFILSIPIILIFRYLIQIFFKVSIATQLIFETYLIIFFILWTNNISFTNSFL